MCNLLWAVVRFCGLHCTLIAPNDDMWLWFSWKWNAILLRSAKGNDVWMEKADNINMKLLLAFTVDQKYNIINHILVILWTKIEKKTVWYFICVKINRKNIHDVIPWVTRLSNSSLKNKYSNYRYVWNQWAELIHLECIMRELPHQKWKIPVFIQYTFAMILPCSFFINECQKYNLGTNRPTSLSNRWLMYKF